jgi:hypothetical protein
LAVSAIPATIRVARGWRASISTSTVVIVARRTICILPPAAITAELVASPFGITRSAVGAAVVVAIPAAPERIGVVVSHVSATASTPTPTARADELNITAIQDTGRHSDSTQENRAVRLDLLWIEIQDRY